MIGRVHARVDAFVCQWVTQEETRVGYFQRLDARVFGRSVKDVVDALNRGARLEAMRERIVIGMRVERDGVFVGERIAKVAEERCEARVLTRAYFRQPIDVEVATEDGGHARVAPLVDERTNLLELMSAHETRACVVARLHVRREHVERRSARQEHARVRYALPRHALAIAFRPRERTHLRLNNRTMRREAEPRASDGQRVECRRVRVARLVRLGQTIEELFDVFQPHLLNAQDVEGTELTQELGMNESFRVLGTSPAQEGAGALCGTETVPRRDSPRRCVHD